MKFSNGVLPLTIAAIAITRQNNIVNAQPYNYSNCAVATYYSSLSSTTSPPREDLHALIKNTHRNQLPYTSSSPDVWDAMMSLDSDASGLKVKLIYGDRLVPADPRDSGSCDYWNREHV